MEKIKYLPLGSIVYLEGGIDKVLIVARGLMVKSGEKTLFFDYGGVPYPTGLAGDQMAYFQHSAIENIVFEGFSDTDDEQAVENINAYLKNHPDTVRGSIDLWQTAE